MLEPWVCQDIGFMSLVGPVLLPGQCRFQGQATAPCTPRSFWGKHLGIQFLLAAVLQTEKRYLLPYQNLTAIGNLQQDREVIGANEIMSSSARGEREKH